METRLDNSSFAFCKVAMYYLSARAHPVRHSTGTNGVAS